MVNRVVTVAVLFTVVNGTVVVVVVVFVVVVVVASTKCCVIIALRNRRLLSPCIWKSTKINRLILLNAFLLLHIYQHLYQLPLSFFFFLFLISIIIVILFHLFNQTSNISSKYFLVLLTVIIAVKDYVAILQREFMQIIILLENGIFLNLKYNC